MNKEKVNSNEMTAALIKSEIAISKELSHPNIVKFIDEMEDEENYYILSEIIKGADLNSR
jgi:serine/threonine protein kinase